jgi:hypothetical protein
MGGHAQQAAGAHNTAAGSKLHSRDGYSSCPLAVQRLLLQCADPGNTHKVTNPLQLAAGRQPGPNAAVDASPPSSWLRVDVLELHPCKLLPSLLPPPPSFSLLLLLPTLM